MSSLRNKPSLLLGFLLGMAVAAAAGGIVVALRSSPSYAQRHATRSAEGRFRAVRPFLREHAVAAELGVLKGDFSRAVVRELKPAKLHLVDPWYLQGPEWPWAYGDRSTVHALSGILRDFAPELGRGQVVLNIGYDQDVLATMPDAYLDWVYVDTTHEYEHTKLELQLLQKKVKPSGVIAGDDWQPNPAHRDHGVYKAVQELLAEGSYEILYADPKNLQWAIRRTKQSAGILEHHAGL
jgi:hypothetical protein